MNNSSKSILLSLTAVVMWASLASFGINLVHIPPFFTLAVAFLIGSIPCWLNPKAMFPDLKTFVVGSLGYFGYHFFLFMAFRFAPAIEANLINYMWPILLVMISPIFFKDAKLKWYHFLGAFLALIGCYVLVMGKGAELDFNYIKGYLLASGAAILWPLYTIFKMKSRPTSIHAIGGFCFGSSILCFATHLMIERSVGLQGTDFLNLIIMGLGPVGLAFYAWDMASKLGDTRVMGAISYLTPVLSTLGLILFAGQTMDKSTTIAMVLILCGASAGILDLRSKSSH